MATLPVFSSRSSTKGGLVQGDPCGYPELQATQIHLLKMKHFVSLVSSLQMVDAESIIQQVLKREREGASLFCNL